MQKVLISAIITAYNRENYVQETIKSIINQTYDNIELIVIDNGSQDGTYAKIKELQTDCEKRFKRFVLLKLEHNSGIGAALNTLILESRGEWIWRVDSDDVAKPNALAVMGAFINSAKAIDYALVVGDNEIIDSKSQRVFWDSNKNNLYKEQKKSYKTFADFYTKRYINVNSKDFGTYKTFIKQNYIPNGYVIRKAVFARTGLYQPRPMLEDWYIMLQISKCAKMKYIDEILLSYRWHGSNIMLETGKINQMYNAMISAEFDILKNLPPEEQKKLLGPGSKRNILSVPFLFSIYEISNTITKEKYFKIGKKSFFLYRKTRNK